MSARAASGWRCNMYITTPRAPKSLSMTKSNRVALDAASVIDVLEVMRAGIMLFVPLPGKYAPGMNPVMRSQAVLAAAHAGRLLVSFAIAAVLGRNLAPADFAFVALLTSIYIVAVEVLDMGTTAVANREIAAHPSTE